MISAAERDDLLAKAELLDALLSATQDGLVDWDLVRGKASYNARWGLMLGFDGDEFRQLSEDPELWRLLIHPDEKESTAQLLEDHLKDDWPFSTTLRLRHRTGGYRHILCRGVAHRDLQGRAVRMTIIFSNIDEQVRGEERQRALISALPDTLFRVRADGVIVGLKRGAERSGSPFLGLREGSTLRECISVHDVRSRLEKAIATHHVGGSFEPQTVQITSGTNAAIQHEVRVVHSGDDESVCIVRDITEQRELESRLLENQKLGAIGQLAAGVAHEINTPMQFIGDNLHFAKGAIDDLLSLTENLKAIAEDAATDPASVAASIVEAEDQADFDYARKTLPLVLERALNGVQRVSQIVRALKTFAHPGDGNSLVPTDLKSLIESTVIVASNEWKYVADIDLQFDDEMPPIPCLGGELNQVVLNLLVNASHAITAMVGQSGEKGRIVISTSRDSTHAEIRIADSGTGIPEHARTRVFEQFFTTKEVGKGTGQGLSLAYSCVVKRHHGSLHFETEVGETHGTTFVIRIPLEARTPAASQNPLNSPSQF